MDNDSFYDEILKYYLSIIIHSYIIPVPLIINRIPNYPKILPITHLERVYRVTITFTLSERASHFITAQGIKVARSLGQTCTCIHSCRLSIASP